VLRLWSVGVYFATKKLFHPWYRVYRIPSWCVSVCEVAFILQQSNTTTGKVYNTYEANVYVSVCEVAFIPQQSNTTTGKVYNTYEANVYVSVCEVAFIPQSPTTPTGMLYNTYEAPHLLQM
jgi:hypothetical protein